MRSVTLALLASFVLFSCGKPGEEGASFVYSGDGSEWTTDSVPGSPEQPKPIFSNRARPALAQVSSITPTVYYTPKINADDARAAGCNLVNAGDWQICENSFRNCLMQGSCFISMSGAWRYFMKAGKAAALRARSQGRCRFGVGFGSCVIPNVSIAADLSMHKIGDVIYVPELDGRSVPYIGRHDGFLVVHDKGGAIVGQERFDFFTGHMGPRDPRNALARWGFGDKKRKFSYVKLSAAEAIDLRREKGI